jgi:hypothetical protein
MTMAETSPNLPPKKPLSEISHLFLSSIRDKHGETGPSRPQRIPPGGKRSAPAHSLDLTPEEFERMFGQTQSESDTPAPAPRRVPVAAVIAPHLNGQQVERVRQYAAHLAAGGERVGLILVDASEFRLLCFEHNPNFADGNQDADLRTIQVLDPRRMHEALTELHEDVDRWLLCVPSPRGPEARQLLQTLRHWVVLATCDHDGIVSSYRTLKGLADIARPRLSVALLDADSLGETEKVMRKLNHVCLQFLGWEMEGEPPVKPATHIAEHSVLWCRAANDKAQLASAPQWDVLRGFLEKVLRRPEDPAVETAAVDEDELLLADTLSADDDEEAEMPETHAPAAEAIKPVTLSFSPQAAEPVVEPVVTISPTAAPAPRPVAPASPVMQMVSDDGCETVIDLPSSATAPGEIARAVMDSAGEWIATPLKAPMCPDATVAVSRDRQLTLVAATQAGLADLRKIAQAYRWLCENRQLVSMALPQFSLDASATPRMQLLIDHADSGAQTLQPILESTHVSVRVYRRLRWGGKVGLLLEAA